MVNSFGFFDINNTLITLWSYPLSYTEFIGTVFGLNAVWLATRQKIISWPLGMISVACFFVLLFQVQLYSGMFLQAFFFFSNIYGWIIWSKQLSGNEAPTVLTTKWRLWIALLIAATTLLVGLIIQQLPTLFPTIFPKPASQVYFDAFVAIASIAGQVMLTRRIFDNWYIWLIVNCVSVFVFFRQGLYLLTIEYIIFVLLAIKGIVDWKKTTR